MIHTSIDIQRYNPMKQKSHGPERLFAVWAVAVTPWTNKTRIDWTISVTRHEVLQTDHLCHLGFGWYMDCVFKRSTIAIAGGPSSAREHDPPAFCPALEVRFSLFVQHMYVEQFPCHEPAI